MRLFSLFIFIVALAAASSAQTRITSGTGEKGLLAVSTVGTSTVIVYNEIRNGYNIFAYDLVTKQERQLTPDGSAQYNPDIDGSRVVWNDARHGGSHIYLYDLLTNTETRITTGNNSDTRPVIRGNRIIFLRTSNKGTVAVSYDLVLKRETVISSRDKVDIYEPVGFDGVTAVWADNRDGNFEIYAYDFLLARERRITTMPLSQYRPRVSGDWVVFEDARDGNPDITTINLVTGQERRLVVAPGYQMYAMVSANLVAWLDDAAGRTVLHDLLTGTTSTLATVTYQSRYPFRHAFHGGFHYYPVTADGATNIYRVAVPSSVAPILGDVDGDGVLTVADVAEVLRIAGGLKSGAGLVSRIKQDTSPVTITDASSLARRLTH
jgi:TolB protein